MVIKKRISFDFLGEGYEDAYGVFATIPISEYPDIAKTVDAEDNSVKKTQLMLEVVRKKFVSGKFPNDKGDLEDLTAGGFDPDGELLLTVYNRLMGGTGDPKAFTPSKSS